MRETSAELFDQIVFAVTNLLHGEHIGTQTIYQRMVAAALRHAGVETMIQEAFRPIGQTPEPAANPSPKSNLPKEWVFGRGDNNE